MFVMLHGLPNQLDFAGYYGMIQDEVVVEIMEIRASSWIALVALLFANVALQETAEGVSHYSSSSTGGLNASSSYPQQQRARGLGGGRK